MKTQARSVASKGRPSFERSVAKVLSFVILPFIALLLYSNLYSIGVSNRLIAQSNQQVVSQWAKQIDINLEMIERFLAGIVYIEPEFDTFGKGETQLNVHLASYAITQRMDAAMNVFSGLGGIFLYGAADHAWAERFADGTFDYQTREAIRAAIHAREAWDHGWGAWQVFSAGGRNMLALCYGRDGAYMIALTDFSRLITTAQDTYTVFFADAQGESALNRADWVSRNAIRLPKNDRQYAFTGTDDRYMVVSERLGRAPAHVVLAVSNAGYWDGLTALQTILLIISLLMILAIPLSRWWVRRYLGRPLANLSATMNRIKLGELSTQITQDYFMEELEQVKYTFNDMIAQIHTLKIEAYDREIDRQRIEMQYLQLQLRPHFFLNCLTNVYACVRRQRYQQVQELILSISDYIRFLFRNNLKTVTLREELRFVQDYIRIQQMSLVLPPECEITVDEALLDLHIPPFSVESFVENAVKHQWKPDSRLVISVRAILLESDDGQYLDITVRDNGAGFPGDMLEIINSLSGNADQGRHVGLTNLRQRLSLIYGERATLAFYNEESGAVSEVIFPVALMEGEGEK